MGFIETILHSAEKKFQSYLPPTDLSQAEKDRIRFFLGTSLCFLILFVINLILNLKNHQELHKEHYVIMFMTVIMLFKTIYYRSNIKILKAGFSLCLIIYLGGTFFSVFGSGLHSPGILFITVLPLVSAFLLERKTSLAFTVLSMITVAVLHFYPDLGELPIHDPSQHHILSLMNIELIIILTAFLGISGQTLLHSKNAHLSLNRRKSEEEGVKLEKVTRELEHLKNQTREKNVKTELFFNTLSKRIQELRQFNIMSSAQLSSPVKHIQEAVQMLYHTHNHEFTGNASVQLEEVLTWTAKLSQSLQSFSEYSKLEYSNTQKQLVSLTRTLLNTWEELSPLVQQKNASLIHGKLPDLFADPLQTSKLFFQILSNSLIHSDPENYPQIQISTTYHSTTRKLDIIIKDNGSGIPSQKMTRIFKIYSETSPDLETLEMAGIGLAMAKKIIDNHGWEIRAETSQGGTSIIISVPDYNQTKAYNTIDN